MSTIANDTRTTLRGQEDWDIQGHTSSLVANGGIPRVAVNRGRGRGRGRGIDVPSVLPPRPVPSSSIPPVVRPSPSHTHKRGRGAPDHRPRGRPRPGPSGVGFARGSPYRGRGGSRTPSDSRRDYEDGDRRDPRIASTWRPPQPQVSRSFSESRDYRAPESHAGPSRQRVWSPSEPVGTIPHPSYTTSSHSAFAKSSHQQAKPAPLPSKPRADPTPTHTHFELSSDTPVPVESRPPTPPLPEPAPPSLAPSLHPDRDPSPAITKLKFKPNVKGKRKEQPAPAADVHVDEKDIKPEILRAPSPDQPEVPVVDDLDALSGDLWFRRSEISGESKIPDACYDSDGTKKATARAAFKKIKTRELKAQGRKVIHTRWLPDGVVFGWELVTAPTQKLASSSAEPIPLSTTQAIPFPPDFLTSQLRKASNLLFNDWKLERQLAASTLDPIGRLTVCTRSEVTPEGLSIEILPLDPRQPSFPQVDPASHKVYEKKANLRYPDRFDLVDPSSPSIDVVTWVNEMCLARALPDGTGEATRFVACNLGSKKLVLVGRKSEDWQDSPVKQSSATPASKVNGKRAADPSPSTSIVEPSKKAKVNGAGTSNNAQTLPRASTASLATSSPHFVALNEAMDRNFQDIHTWTDMLRDYPNDERVKGQVQRIQKEIFRLQGEIKAEKQRLGIGE